MKYYIITICVLLIACQPKSKSKKNAQLPKTSNKVFFKNINDGDTLINPFIIEMGVVGMKIKAAGLLEAGTGHHHLIIDKGFVDYGEISPMDKQNIHYGKGDTVAQVDLAPGSYSLTLQFANGMHMSYGEQFSSTINVYVK